MTDEYPRTPFYADGTQTGNVSPFIHEFLGYVDIVENTHLPPDDRKSAVLDAYKLLRWADAEYQKRRGPEKLKPDMRQAEYYIRVMLPAWEQKFGLILDGGEPRYRGNGQVIEWPKP